MRDFNFFSPYLLEKRNKRLKKLYIFAVSTMIVVGVVSFSYLTFHQIQKYQEEISRVESYLGSEKTRELLSQYEATKTKLDLTTSYYNKVAAIDKILIDSHTVSTELLYQLSTIMPGDSMLLTLNVAGKQLNLEYSVNDLISVADIEHNIRALGLFSSVHVSVVNNELGMVAQVNCIIKDVSNP